MCGSGEREPLPNREEQGMEDDNKGSAEGTEGHDNRPSSGATAASETPTATDVTNVAPNSGAAAKGGTAAASTSQTGSVEPAKRRSGSLSANLRSFASMGKHEVKERTIDQVRVADGALASIIGLSAHEVPGVVGMAPASITEGIRRILGARQVDEGVIIEHPKGANRADVDLHVVVAYGVNIPVVADSIRERVRYAAHSLAGIELDAVRVHVAGISRG